MPAASHGWVTAGTESLLNHHQLLALVSLPPPTQTSGSDRGLSATTGRGGADVVNQSLIHQPSWRSALAAQLNDFWSCWTPSVFRICLLTAVGWTDKYFFMTGECGWARQRLELWSPLLSHVAQHNTCILCRTVSVARWQLLSSSWHWISDPVVLR